MAAPTVYTFEQLATFMRNQLKFVADDLTDETQDWLDTSEAGPYKDAVEETTVRYFGEGGHEVEEASEVRLLRLYARLEVWRAVMQATVTDYDVGNVAHTLKREQIHLHAVGQFRIAQGDLVAYYSEQQALEVQGQGMHPATSDTARVVVTW